MSLTPKLWLPILLEEERRLERQIAACRQEIEKEEIARRKQIDWHAVTRRRLRVWRLYSIAGWNYTKIGAWMGVTGNRARQIAHIGARREQYIARTRKPRTITGPDWIAAR